MANEQNMSPEAAANAGRMAAQNGQSCPPQQANESLDAYNERVNAYNAEKNKASQ